MVIEEHDFKLEYDESHDRFDYYILKIINAKDPEKRREEFVIKGYSMTLESCLKAIISRRIALKFDSVSIKQYLEEYKNQLNSLKDLADGKWK